MSGEPEGGGHVMASGEASQFGKRAKLLYLPPFQTGPIAYFNEEKT